MLKLIGEPDGHDLLGAWVNRLLEERAELLVALKAVIDEVAPDLPRRESIVDAREVVAFAEAPFQD